MRCKLSCISGVITLAICLFFSSVYAGNDLNFNVPVPGESKLLDSKQLELASRQINTTLFSSQEDTASVVEFYTNFFAQQDFAKLLDKSNTKTGKRLLRFKKDALVVSISIIEKDTFTEIVIAKYLQGPSERSLEDSKPSVKDSLFALPKSDVAGVDIPVVPRPSPSVRIMGLKMGTSTTAMYTTPLDIASTVDFYCTRMPDYNWKLLRQTGTKDATQAYMKASGKKSLGIKSPFSDGEDFEQVVNNSYVLSFAAGSESAEITIFPNFVSRTLGSIVQISYSEK